MIIQVTVRLINPNKTRLVKHNYNKIILCTVTCILWSIQSHKRYKYR